ncbi:MAG TPA: 2-amino-4-hydroxy-6-hydroxymethyldihydropteridine diphosphokinase [Pirellulaceae bacterium]|nr:2-amino-4-hydroxy-6-hydroxymethyldihydropteridine diphosphokinase [Pirellulaceae bacterium]
MAFGSNVGNGPCLYEAAIQRLQSYACSEIVRSILHQTRPIGGPPGQAEFSNGVVRFLTKLSASELVAALHDVEQQLGRQRRERWGQRTVDLDLLLYGDYILDLPHCVVPHPRMTHRRFVLTPACEVGGERQHPIVGLSMRQLLDVLNSRESLVAILSHRDAAFVSARFHPSGGVVPRLNGSGTADDSGMAMIQVEQLSHVRAVGDRIKLLCFDGGWREWAIDASDLQQNYRGPILEIDRGLIDEQARNELMAAIDAMQ